MLPKTPTRLFWDIKDHKPDLGNVNWVSRRIFEQGSVKDIADLIIHYGKDKVIKAMTSTPYMDEDIMYLAAAVLGIPLKEFLCYTTKQYRRVF